jgi:hypothetical protein
MFSRSFFDNAAVAMHRGAVALLLFFVASSSLSQELKEFSNGEVADAAGSQLDSLTIGASGELDEVNDVGNVRLYIDENRDGTPASTERISDGTYSQDDGDIRFEFMDSVQLLNGETHFLITYQL